jgi:aspartate aminotransferase-like enzyme/GNAT superfamily N-acetyltransferase
MRDPPRLEFKIAADESEFEAVHRLNYRTFVEEIPQHAPSSEPRLVDKFHAENTYVICLAHEAGAPPRLIGMVALRERRPFSLDQKLQDLDRWLPPGASACEVRLLAVEPDHRRGAVTVGLIRHLVKEARARGRDYAVISGTTRQLKLYDAIGFKPFGPLVGKGEALFQPMGLSLADFERGAHASLLRESAALRANLLPGPVDVSRAVREAFESPPVSHRSAGFLAEFEKTARRLRELVRARHVEILLGSGTLANEAIALQLKREGRRGLVLSNGEFGDRLLDHAARNRLPHVALKREWGRRFELDALGRVLDREPSVKWIWAVHCETSTGMLNDLPALAGLCRTRGLELCLDCISSIGVVPLDLGDVHLVSGVGNKGLGSYPGLALVFHRDPIEPASNELPRYLDLGYYAECGGVPFTHSSNLVYALKAALEERDWPAKFAELEQTARWLRGRLAAAGLATVAGENHSSPAVFTIAVPGEVSSLSLGESLERAGFLLSYRSRYLIERNWIQFCLMNGARRPDLEELLRRLPRLLRRHDGRASSVAAAG